MYFTSYEQTETDDALLTGDADRTALSFLQHRPAARQNGTGLREASDLSIATRTAVTDVHSPGVTAGVPTT